MYGVCSVLGVFLAPDRQALLFYVLFFGHYPALFAVLGRIRAKALRYVAKLLVFNAAMALEVLLSVYLLGIPFESFAILGPWARCCWRCWPTWCSSSLTGLWKA